MRKEKNLKQPTWKNTVTSDFKRNKQLYLMMLPVIVFFVLFCYLPMYGALIAFMGYRPSLGFMGSDWVGFKHFANFLSSPSFGHIFMNTVNPVAWISRADYSGIVDE